MKEANVKLHHVVRMVSNVWYVEWKLILYAIQSSVGEQYCLYLCTIPSSCKTLLKLLQIQSNMKDISLDCL